MKQLLGTLRKKSEKKEQGMDKEAFFQNFIIFNDLLNGLLEMSVKFGGNKMPLESDLNSWLDNFSAYVAMVEKAKIMITNYQMTNKEKLSQEQSTQLKNLLETLKSHENKAADWKKKMEEPLKKIFNTAVEELLNMQQALTSSSSINTDEFLSQCAKQFPTLEKTVTNYPLVYKKDETLLIEPVLADCKKKIQAWEPHFNFIKDLKDKKLQLTASLYSMQGKNITDVLSILGDCAEKVVDYNSSIKIYQTKTGKSLSEQQTIQLRSVINLLGSVEKDITQRKENMKGEFDQFIGKMKSEVEGMQKNLLNFKNLSDDDFKKYFDRVSVLKKFGDTYQRLYLEGKGLELIKVVMKSLEDVENTVKIWKVHADFINEMKKKVDAEVNIFEVTEKKKTLSDFLDDEDFVVVDEKESKKDVAELIEKIGIYREANKKTCSDAQQKQFDDLLSQLNMKTKKIQAQKKETVTDNDFSDFIDSLEGLSEQISEMREKFTKSGTSSLQELNTYIDQVTWQKQRIQSYHTEHERLFSTLQLKKLIEQQNILKIDDGKIAELKKKMKGTFEEYISDTHAKMFSMQDQLNLSKFQTLSDDAFGEYAKKLPEIIELKKAIVNYQTIYSKEGKNFQSIMENLENIEKPIKTWKKHYDFMGDLQMDMISVIDGFRIPIIKAPSKAGELAPFLEKFDAYVNKVEEYRTLITTYQTTHKNTLTEESQQQLNALLKNIGPGSKDDKKIAYWKTGDGKKILEDLAPKKSEDKRGSKEYKEPFLGNQQANIKKTEPKQEEQKKNEL